MTSEPRLSVIVPAWNAATSLGRALDSVLADPEADLECIVVDDGSTDGTADLAERRAATDPRVVVIRLARNEGVSHARNRALEVARGSWLAFLDADDRFLPGGLAALVAATRIPGVLAIIGQRLWSDGRLTWRSAEYDIPDIRVPGRRSLATHPGLLFYAATTGKVFHRSITEGLEFEGRVLGDQPWTIRALIRAGDRILVLGTDVYEWRRPRARGSSASITASKYASAHRAAEAVRVAVGALAAVGAEAEERIPTPDARRAVVGGYFERLVRADLAGPVARAARRGDVGSDELFVAIREFLAAAPPELAGDSTSVAELILRPPLDRWPRLREPGRTAYWELLVWALRAYPGLAPRVSRFSLLRPALWLLRRSDFGRSRRLALALIWMNWPIGAVRRSIGWVRRRLSQLRRVRGPAR